MERPKGRRSSLLSQAAQKERYDVQIEKHVAEIVKQLPLPHSIAAPNSTRFRSSGSSKKGAMNRANSMESLCSMTPATPNIRYSRSPGKLLFSESKCDSVAKTLKVPLATDKRSVNTIAAMVSDFLQEHNYSQFPALDKDKKLSLSQYLDACRFTLQLMMGPSFLANLKQDELSAKLLEISVTLRYPGTLSKSVMKSPNSSHSWPFALTFLAFLCARVDAAISPIPSMIDNPINEIKDPESYADDILVESYSRLFFQLLSSGKYSLEEELEMYRQRLREMSYDNSQSVEELTALAQQKQQYLDEKEAEEDPRSELLEVLGTQKKVLSELKQKKAELQQQLRKVADIGAVKAKRASLLHSLDAAKMERQKADELIKTQKVNIHQRKDLIKSIEESRLRREALEQVNIRTKTRLQNREQYVKTSQKRFYDVCSRLNVSNRFNENLQKLELMREVENMERLSSNPFNSEDLGEWLKDAKRIHGQTKSQLYKQRDSLQESISKFNAEIASCMEAESKREAYRQELESRTRHLKEDRDKEFALINEERKGQTKQLRELKAECESLRSTQANEMRIQELQEQMANLQMEKEALLDKLTNAEEEHEKLLLKIEEIDGPVTSFIQDQMVQHLEKRREIVRKDLGIDLLSKC